MRGREASHPAPFRLVRSPLRLFWLSLLRRPSSMASSSYSTQLEAGGQGVAPPGMESVARREDLAPDLVRDEVARGRMVIPANKAHLKKRLEPMAIGVA